MGHHRLALIFEVKVCKHKRGKLDSWNIWVNKNKQWLCLGPVSEMIRIVKTFNFCFQIDVDRKKNSNHYHFFFDKIGTRKKEFFFTILFIKIKKWLLLMFSLKEKNYSTGKKNDHFFRAIFVFASAFFHHFHFNEEEKKIWNFSPNYYNHQNHHRHHYNDVTLIYFFYFFLRP